MGYSSRLNIGKLHQMTEVYEIIKVDKQYF